MLHRTSYSGTSFRTAKLTMGETDKKPMVTSTATEPSSKNRWRNRKRRHDNKSTVQPEKLRGSKEELEGNYFDCTGYGQSDRYMKTVQKTADYVGQEYKGGGVTRTEVMTQTLIAIPGPTRPVSTSTTAADGTITTTPPDMLDISNYQRAKKILDYKVQSQTEN